MTDDGGRRTEDRGQMAEDRRQRVYRVPLLLW